MKEKNLQELERIMTLYQHSLDKLKAEREGELQTQERFMIEFDRVKKSVIWPVLIDVGNQLTRYGHDFRVMEEEEYIDATAFYHPAMITFYIFPAVLGRSPRHIDSMPYISFVADRYAKKVTINVSTMMPNTGGVVGSHGSFELDKITAELVEAEIVQVLKNIPLFRREEA
ncbi:MAG: hypothetical protein BWY68_00460 [bacterium ADurb.Bin400]|nr:MAG: hypothetical protein BWY68_00460 [bacterium ADurb.Bin400]